MRLIGVSILFLLISGCQAPQSRPYVCTKWRIHENRLENNGSYAEQYINWICVEGYNKND